MFPSRRPGMSVRPGAPYMVFPSYLRANVHGPTHQPSYPVRTTQQRVPQLRAMASNPNLAAAYSAHQHGVDTGVPSQSHQQVSHQADTLTEVIESFDDFVQYPEDMFGPSKLSEAPDMFHSAAPTQFSFRPMEPNQRVLHQQMPPLPQPNNSDTHPSLSTPGVLSGHFDPAQYRPFPYEDMAWASLNQNSLSTVSIKTEVSSPITPGLHDGGHTMDWHSKQEPYIVHERLGGFDHPASNTGYGYFHGVDYAPVDGAPAMENLRGIPRSLANHPILAYPGTILVTDTNVPSLRGEVRDNAIVQADSASPQDIERRASTPSGASEDEDEDEGSVSSSGSSQLLVEETPAVRSHRDELLLDMWRQGHSYKNIKRRGRFWEAESTLRGRVRALTKAKSERVRKPKWETHDVRPLLGISLQHAANCSSSLSSVEPCGILRMEPARRGLQRPAASYLGRRSAHG